jgi:hypothetical protein
VDRIRCYSEGAPGRIPLGSGGRWDVKGHLQGLKLKAMYPSKG